MSSISEELSVIAYYLSEYDMRAVIELGYHNRSAAFKDISIVMGRDNNYLKRRRDEFDVITSSTRRGQCNRPVLKSVQAVFDKYKGYSFDEITLIVKSYIASRQTTTQETELKEDATYIQEINNSLTPNKGRKHFASAPIPKREETAAKSIRFPRDPIVAANALCNANYRCEICATHATFIRKSNGKPYTEPHHLVPMKAQKDFGVSLDVENNVVSLCSNCHNQIHYGMDIDSILKPLYEQRKELLEKIGIHISFDKLKIYYNAK